jgi:hypothetical protein
MKRITLLLLLAASTSFAGEPKISVDDCWQKLAKRPEMARASVPYGEPTITVGDIKPVRRPELARWWMAPLFARWRWTF